MNVLSRLLFQICLLAALVIAPLEVLRARTAIVPPDQAGDAEAALIFGALVREGRISPLHAERLDAAIALYRSGKVDRLIVSNAARAAEIMAAYLREHGVPEGDIEIDANALKTPHTCANEMDRGAPRRVILISQRFHLPRIAYQCRKLGLTGQYVEADQPHHEVSGVRSPITVFRIRAGRYIREAALVWASLIEAYPDRPT